VKGAIRNERSHAAQGQRSGFVSQAVAGLLDAFTVMLLYTAVLLLYGINVLFFTGNPFHFPQPEPLASVALYYAIGLILFTTTWSGSGRTPAMAFVGLRILDASGRPLSPRRAFWRAVIVIPTIGLGIITVLFSRKNKSLYDMICGSAVVYAWRANLSESRQNQ